VALLLARVELWLSFGILGPVDQLLGGVKPSDPLFAESRPQHLQ
jgi:hypothetical protein